MLKVQKYDYTLHPDAKKLVSKKAAEHIPKWREEGKTEEYDYLPKAPLKPRRQKNGSVASASRKPPAPEHIHAATKHIYQESEDPNFSNQPTEKSIWPEDSEMVPLDKHSIMS